MKLGYTEFSFGYGFTENLIRSASTATGGAPYFPNLVQEGQLGYDVRINFPGCPLFLQYKLPDLMIRDSAAEISKLFLKGLVTPFFRMHLMKKSISRQHELLVNLEQRYPNSVYYASPALRSSRLFNAAYNSATVHLQSVLFSPNDIGPLPDDDPHVVAYRDGLPYAWFCSKPREIFAFGFGDVANRIGRSFEDPRYETLQGIARSTLEELVQMIPRPLRNSENAIRQRIRDRASLDEATTAVVEDLLVSRVLARVALGLEFVIAQPAK